MCLGRIFNDEKPVRACKFQDRIHVRRLPEKVNRNDRFGPLRQALLKLRRIHRERVLVYINKYWSSFAISNGLGGGDKRVWNRNHFIAFTNSKRQESKPKGIRAVAYGDCVGGSAGCSELFFKLFHERPTGKSAALDHFVNSKIEFFNKRGVMRLQIEEGYFHFMFERRGRRLGVMVEVPGAVRLVAAELAR